MFTPLFFYSLSYGLILSAFLTVVILGSLRWNPEIWLNDFPPDVRAKYGPEGQAAKKQRRVISVLFILGILALLVISILGLVRVLGEFSFTAVFLHTFIMLMVFNLTDLLLIDWLVLMLLRPAWSILPGTEGMAGYRDYGFPFRGFIKGTVGILAGSLVIAGVAWIFTFIL